MIVKNGILTQINNEDIVRSKLVIPQGVKKIRASAFGKSDKLIKNFETLKEVVLPEGIEEIDECVFQDCTNLRKINFPKSLKIIGDNAFQNTAIKEADISNVTQLGKYVFEGCLNLKSVKLNDNLTTIDDGTFCDCKRLTKINISSKLETINQEAFFYCSALNKIDLPSSVKYIGSMAFTGCGIKQINNLINIEYIGLQAFSYCDNLTQINIPESCKYLEERAFCSCENLEIANIQANIKMLPENIFYNCEKLFTVTLPKTLEIIGQKAFCDCKNLTNINFPENLISISNNAFNACKRLKHVVFPQSLCRIGDNAFKLSGVEEINFPNAIKEINTGSFSDCFNLKSISLPKNLLIIWCAAFQNCEKLTDVEFPEILTRIDNFAFKNTGLKSIKFGEKMQQIGEHAFSNCKNLQIADLQDVKIIAASAFMRTPELKRVIVPNVNMLGNFNFNDNSKLEEFVINRACETNFSISHKYMTKKEDCFIFTSQEREGSKDISKLQGLKLQVFNLLYDKQPKYLKECENENIKELNNYFISCMTEKQFVDFVENRNVKFFKVLPLNSNSYLNEALCYTGTSIDRNDFYKFYYNLGGFKQPVKETSISKSGKLMVKYVDYAQKVAEFLKDVFSSEFLQMITFHAMFDSMRYDGFKPEFSKFFLDKKNFKELMDEEENHNGFIASCYNEFENVQQVNTSNRGEQRQLKPTVEKFKEYFRSTAYQNITPETAEIAETISGYFPNQKDFDNAVAIDAERKKNKVPDHILSSPLKEADVFAEIDRISKEIDIKNADTLGILTELANKNFRFEWLAKNDPKNFILGKLCTSCAHLEGAGYGIMHASIVHPDVQNLVIRDKTSKIVAKSTLYINRRDGYGVFNNVETNNRTTDIEKGIIYKKYIAAIKLFVQKYNSENPHRPLKQINVGMNLNDLETQIRKQRKKSKTILEPLDYSKYGIQGKSYRGDSLKEQYILWTEKDGFEI